MTADQDGSNNLNAKIASLEAQVADLTTQLTALTTELSGVFTQVMTNDSKQKSPITLTCPINAIAVGCRNRQANENNFGSAAGLDGRKCVCTYIRSVFGEVHGDIDAGNCATQCIGVRP